MFLFQGNLSYFIVLILLKTTILIAITPVDKNLQEFILYTEQYPKSQSGSSVKRHSFDGNIKDLSALWEPVGRNEVKSWCSATQGM